MVDMVEGRDLTVTTVKDSYQDFNEVRDNLTLLCDIIGKFCTISKTSCYHKHHVDTVFRVTGIDRHMANIAYCRYGEHSSICVPIMDIDICSYKKYHIYNVVTDHFVHVQAIWDGLKFYANENIECDCKEDVYIKGICIGVEIKNITRVCD